MLEAQAENPGETTANGEILSSLKEASAWPSWLGLVALVLPVIMGTVILLKDDVRNYQLHGLMFVTVLVTALCLALDSWLKPAPKPGKPWKPSIDDFCRGFIYLGDWFPGSLFHQGFWSPRDHRLDIGPGGRIFSGLSISCRLLGRILGTSPRQPANGSHGFQVGQGPVVWGGA
jgi:hypothetical protein